MKEDASYETVKSFIGNVHACDGWFERDAVFFFLMYEKQ